MTIRVGVIGVGSMGRNHARVYSELEGVELVGVADEDAQAAEAIATKYGCSSYTDFRRLLDETELDALTVAVPTVEHLDVALEVIARGVHLLIEKPISSNVEEGQKIIESAASEKLILMIGHIERFNPAVIELKERLEGGELGRVFQIDARREGPLPTRIQDVGVVIDLAVHDLDVIRYVTGSEIVRVYAETERRIHSTHEDLLAGLVRLEDGTVGTLAINWLTPTKIRELYVTGERGMFRVDYLTQDLYFFENVTTQSADWDTLRVLRGVSEGKMIRHVIAKKEPLRIEQEAFIAAVLGEKPVPVSGQDGLKALELAHAIVASGQEHRMIEVH